MPQPKLLPGLQSLGLLVVVVEDFAMFPSLLAYENSIIQRLAPVVSDKNITIRGYPDEPDTHIVAMTGMGLCLVGWSGIQSTKPTNTTFSELTYVSNLAWELLLIHRGGKTYKAAYATVEQIVSLLNGFELEPYSRLWLDNVEYRGRTEQDYHWVYSIVFNQTLKWEAGVC